MAKINGFQVRDVRTFVGKEDDCQQGTLELNGSEILFWSDDMNGGPMWYIWNYPDKTEIDRLADNAVLDILNAYECNLECLIHMLLNLSDIEKSWKRAGKKPRAAFWNSSAWHICLLGTNEYSLPNEELLTHSRISGEMNEFEFQFGPCYAAVFRENSDFNIQNVKRGVYH